MSGDRASAAVVNKPLSYYFIWIYYKNNADVYIIKSHAYEKSEQKARKKRPRLYSKEKKNGMSSGQKIRNLKNKTYRMRDLNWNKISSGEHMGWEGMACMSYDSNVSHDCKSWIFDKSRFVSCAHFVHSLLFRFDECVILSRHIG